MKVFGGKKVAYLFQALKTDMVGPEEMRWRPLGSRKGWGVHEEILTAKGTCLYLHLKYPYLHEKTVFTI